MASHFDEDGAVYLMPFDMPYMDLDPGTPIRPENEFLAYDMIEGMMPFPRPRHAYKGNLFAIRPMLKGPVRHLF